MSDKYAHLLQDDEEVVIISQKQSHFRHNRKRIVVIVLSVLFAMLCVGVVTTILVLGSRYDAPPTTYKNTVIMVSLDGFRPEYLHRNASLTPNLLRLAKNGVSAKKMQPIFPSKTFPNHYTIVTGLYAENHGIISNHFYDPVFNATFDIWNAAAVTDGRWWGGEPIWVTASKNNLITGAYFWPGSEAEIDGRRPDHYVAYNGKVPYSDRINQLFAWLDLPEQPTFLCTYLEGVDSAGHNYGPNSVQVEDAIVAVDVAIGQLIQGLEDRGVLDQTDIIVVSDHGMTEISNDRVIVLENYIDLNDVTVIDYSPILQIIPKPGKLDEVFSRLVGAHPNLTVTFKENTTQYFEYRDNRRICPIVGVADLGWSIASSRNWNQTYSYNGGNHGYDNRYDDMQAIFIAQGPHFKTEYQVDSILNLDVYPLLCELLQIEPAVNNGTLRSDILAK